MPLMSNGVQINIDAKNNASPVIKQVADDIGGLEQKNKDAATSAGQASQGMEGMVLSASTLTQALSIVTVGVGAFISAFEFGEIAAGNERLITSGEQLAARYGASLDEIVAKVREASLGTVSNMDIIASANKAMMLGIGADADQLANLMEIAAFRGRAMGISTAQAFDDMARGIGRMSPMILDNLGIIVDAKTTYGAYAESIGKSATELTRAEKIQALLNKVIEEGNAQLEDAGGLAEDAATSYERWNAELENTKNQLLENTLGMSRFADMGADLLISFQDLADNGFGYGGEKLNAFSLFMDFGAARVAAMNEEMSQGAGVMDSYAYAVATGATRITELATATETVAEVDAAAVRGAIEVYETYESLNVKMADLQLGHDELLLKKQQLMEQGWTPESQKIQDVNSKLAENEQKQRDVTAAMQGTLAQMILNTAAAGLDAEGQLALARATGQISESTYAALTVQGQLKSEYENGGISAQEYATRTLALRDAVNQLQDKNITISVDSIMTEIRRAVSDIPGGGVVIGQTGATRGTRRQGFADGGISTGSESGHMELLHGTEAVIPLKDGSVPVQMMGNAGGGGNYYINFTYAPAMSLGDEREMRDHIAPVMVDLLREAQNNGVIPS